MKFEKLSENKIKITLSNKELSDENLDFDSFMSDSPKSQTLFLDMLNRAEKEVGFVTRDYKIKIEALAMNDGNYILTITRLTPEPSKVQPKKKVQISRKHVKLDSECAIYSFYTFEEFVNFCTFLKQNHMENLSDFCQNIQLYFYQSKYYLVFSGINTYYSKLASIYSAITEFATYVSSEEIFITKLDERAKEIFKENAINSAINYFCK